MYEQDRRGREKLRDEIAIRDRVHAVARRARESELGCHQLRVDRQRRARDRSRAQWQNVRARVCVTHALVVAREHVVVREQVMAEQHRLGTLQMRVPGHDGVDVRLRRLAQRQLQRGDAFAHARDRVLQEHAHVGDDLVVTAARRVELCADCAGLLDEAALDRHVDVFVGNRRHERARIQLAADLVERFDDPVAIARGENAARCEHLRVRRTRAHVVRVQSNVEPDRRCERLRVTRRGLAKSAAPSSACPTCPTCSMPVPARLATTVLLASGHLRTCPASCEPCGALSVAAHSSG